MIIWQKDSMPPSKSRITPHTLKPRVDLFRQLSTTWRGRGESQPQHRLVVSATFGHHTSKASRNADTHTRTHTHTHTHTLLPFSLSLSLSLSRLPRPLRLANLGYVFDAGDYGLDVSKPGHKPKPRQRPPGERHHQLNHNREEKQPIILIGFGDSRYLGDEP